MREGLKKTLDEVVPKDQWDLGLSREAAGNQAHGELPLGEQG